MSATERSVQFALRDLRPEDLPRMLEIEQSAFSTPWRRSTFDGLLRRPDADLIGATWEERLMGYAVTWTIMDQAELGNVAVAGEARQRGLGKVLVEAALARVRQRGARECFLEVRESNLEALRRPRLRQHRPSPPLLLPPGRGRAGDAGGARGLALGSTTKGTEGVTEEHRRKAHPIASVYSV